MNKKILLLGIVGTLVVGGAVTGLVIATQKINNSDSQSSTIVTPIVEKPNVDDCLLPSQNIPFDGEKHSLTVTNLPISCYAEYSEQNLVLPGKYNVTANIFFDGGSTPEKLKSLEGTLTIYKTENTDEMLIPRLKEIEIDKQTERLNSSELKLDILLDNVYTPEDMVFSFNYGPKSESDGYLLEYEKLDEKKFLYTVTVSRLNSNYDSFVVNYAYSKIIKNYCQINKTLNIKLPKEFTYYWQETENTVDLIINNAYSQNPTSVLISNDGNDLRKTINSNDEEIAVSFTKSEISGVHEVFVKEINFFSYDKISALEFSKTPFRYAIKEKPEELFGTSVLCSNLENYNFGGKTLFALYVEKNIGKDASIESIKFSTSYGTFTENVKKTQLVELDEKIYYKFFVETEEFFGGDTISFSSLISNEAEYPISFEKEVEEKAYSTSVSCSSTFDYETNKTDISIAFNKPLNEKISPSKMVINNEEFDFQNSLTLDGYVEEISLSEIRFTDTKENEHELSFETAHCETELANKITEIEIINQTNKLEGTAENLVIRSDEKILASEIISVEIFENSETTTITEDFVQKSDYEIEIPYQIVYADANKTVKITDFVYSNEKQFTIDEEISLNFTGTSVLNIVGYRFTDYIDPVTGAREFILNLSKNADDLEIKEMTINLHVGDKTYLYQEWSAVHKEENPLAEYFYFSVPIDFDDTTPFSFEIKKIKYERSGVVSEKEFDYSVIWQ